jgi:glycosyltransferase involved in cell wall biosynthesis
MSATNAVRVLQLGSSIGLYGAERWILALVKALPRTQIESIVSILRVKSYKELVLCEQATRMGLETQVFDANSRISWKVIRQLRKFIRNEHIDILHTHGFKTDVFGLLAVLGTKCKIVTTTHGWTINPTPKIWIYEFINRLILPFFDAIIPVSQGLYDGIKCIPGVKSKAVLIEGGVDLDEIDSIQDLDKEILSWREDGFFVVGYIGRLVEGKGIATLLEAIVLSGNQKIRLAIVGDGVLRDRLKAYTASLAISDAVRFFGFRDDRICCLLGFDVFVLPSRSEGLPQCLMEAMAIGIPVIGTDIVGCRTLIHDRVTGLLFPVDDAASLADKLALLVSDMRLRIKIGHNGRALVRSSYTAERMAARYVDLYKSLMN